MSDHASLNSFVALFFCQATAKKYFPLDHYKAAFETQHDEFLKKHNVIVDRKTLSARGLFDEQPDIPFILLTPIKDEEEQDIIKPLIIHVHGGPNVHIDEDIINAEIAYFLSRGYIVACPNYRGSTGNYLPDWEKVSHDRLHILGPEDVYAVAKYLLCDESYCCDSGNVFLRGGSFGSHINAHLLAGIKAGKFEAIFKAAHLSGGLKFPAATDLPDDIPLLITHGALDDISPCSAAKTLMQNTLLQRLAIKPESPHHAVHTFIATQGDHHLTSESSSNNYVLKSLLESEIRSDISVLLYSWQLDETQEFLTLMTTFFDNLIVQGIPPQKTTTVEQLELLETIDIANRQLAHSYVRQQVPSKLQLLTPEAESLLRLSRRHGPSRSLLQLYLQEEYSDDLLQDMRLFFGKKFIPYRWAEESEGQITDAGSQILDDSQFFQQLVDLVDTEDGVITAHPELMVLYHAGSADVLFIYFFFDLWQKVFSGKLSKDLSGIGCMRFYEYIGDSFPNIHDFLTTMERWESTHKYFNHIDGFADRAIAANPTIFSNIHTTAACTLWWYFRKDKSGTRLSSENLSSMLGDFFTFLGINTEDRVRRYMQLFARFMQTEAEIPGGFLQQMFIPYAKAKEDGYLCQIWGKTLKPATTYSMPDISSVETIRDLTATPFKFESELQKQSSRFHDCHEFLDFKTPEKIILSSLLQTRLLCRPGFSSDFTTKTYFRSPQSAIQLANALLGLIKEDAVEFIVTGSQVPRAITPYADEFRRKFRRQNPSATIVPNPPALEYYLRLLEMYEKRLTATSPEKLSYTTLQQLQPDVILKLQEHYRKQHEARDTRTLCLFSPCIYLKGYTYYNLISEALDAHFAAMEKIFASLRCVPEETKDQCRKKNQELKELLIACSIPAVVTRERACYIECKYHDFYRQSASAIADLKLDYKKHSFFSNYDGKVYYDSYLWSQELTTARELALRYMRLAKEYSYGHCQSVDRRLQELFGSSP